MGPAQHHGASSRCPATSSPGRRPGRAATADIPFPTAHHRSGAGPRPGPDRRPGRRRQPGPGTSGASSPSRPWTVPDPRRSGGVLGVGLVTPTGAPTVAAGHRRHRTAAGGGHRLLPGRPAPAGGRPAAVVEPAAPPPCGVGAPDAVTAEDRGGGPGRRAMQYGVVPPHWVFTGDLGSFGVFRNTRAQGWAWARRRAGGTAPAGTAVHGRGARPPSGSQRITVHATGPVGAGAQRVVEPGLARHHPDRATDHRTAPPGRPATGGRRARRHGPAGGATGAGRVPGDLHLPHRLGARWGLAVSAVAGVGLVAWAVAEGSVCADAGPSAGRRRPRGLARAEEPDGVGGPR